MLSQRYLQYFVGRNVKILLVTAINAAFNRRNARRDWDLNRASVASDWSEKNVTLCAEFHDLLTLNEVLFAAFSVDFHYKQDSLHA